MTRSRKFIISGGGTGGHIFPAIAIANELKLRFPDAQILFVGARGKMEMEKVPQAGYAIEGLWISGLQRRLTLKNLLFPLKVISSLWKAGSIIRRFRPDAVVGSGGFASGPVLRVAAGKGIPSLILEQNSYPGITNKLLAGKVDKICVAYPGMEKFFPKDKIILTGNPIRTDILDLKGKKPEGSVFFGTDPSLKTVLFIGGSLGAGTINETVQSLLDFFRESGIQVIWQTGKSYIEKAREAGKGFDTIKIFDFIHRMDLAYACADIIVSRAGAIAISELCAVGKPAILIPSPFVAEDHQTKNAKVLAENKAAILVRDQDAKTMLKDVLQQVCSDVSVQQRLSHNIEKLAIRDAASRIADEIIHLIH